MLFQIKKMFKTWNCFFGHIRKHNVREARKLPPSVFTPPNRASLDKGIFIEEELAPVLLNLPQQVVLQSTRPDGLIIDLNDQPSQSSHNHEEAT